MNFVIIDESGRLYTKNQTEFFEIIKNEVEALKEMTWKEIKQKEKVKA